VGRVRAAELIPGFDPEDERERAVTEDPELLAGLAWGKPRSGHPEGRVGAHVADLLGRIDARGEAGERRRELRFLALVHDSFKYRVAQGLPRVGENHHAMRARRFAERYTDVESLLSALELHDRPYQIWRRCRRRGQLDEPAFARMMERLPDPELFLAFVEVDGSTEGKRAEPVRWFRGELERRGSLST
jgi:hypothetical protein